MALPTPRLPLALVLNLLLAVDAGAQTPSDPNERRIVLSEYTAESPPEIRVRPGVATVIRFVDAPIVPGSVELDGSRVNLFDKSTRSLIVEPLAALGPKERLGLSVQFVDKQSPAKATFVLVAAPDVADGRVAVIRQGLSVEALSAVLEEVRAELGSKEAELQSLRARAAATGPSGLVLQGFLDSTGVTTEGASCTSSAEDGVKCSDAYGVRARSWTLVVVSVENIGREPWAPAEARLTRAAGGKSEKPLAVHMKTPQLAPGETGIVAVEMGAPPWNKGEVFRLELRDGSGTRRILIPALKL